MNKGSMAGCFKGLDGTLFSRVRSMIDEGISRADVMDKLVSKGSNPGTVESYLREYAGREEERDWHSHAKDACDAHLADLWREHGAAAVRP